MDKRHTFREICYENKRKPHLCYVYTTSDVKTRINKSVYSQRKIEWFANGRYYTIDNRSSVNDYVTLRHELKLNDKYVYCSIWHNRKIHWFRDISLTLKYLADDEHYTFKGAMYLSNKPKYNCISKISRNKPTNKYRMNNFNKKCRKLHSFKRFT